MRFVLFADGEVGFRIASWLTAHFSDDIALLVTLGDPRLTTLAEQARIKSIVFESSQQVCDVAMSLALVFDAGILAWWPKIISQPLLALPRLGFINTHPSYLPYNRGKHYNFWTIVENVPFGVSLHMVEESIDTGDIVAQSSIPTSWEDTGGSLYRKAANAMVELFKQVYPTIRSGDFPRLPQNRAAGSFHLSAELDAASTVALDKSYVARDLLNLMRARTFPGHPACTFIDGGETFEVRVDIKRKVS